ncbi:hypothetical protein FA95DRAFT_890220 [Auriscalpium vulgare]|uniref:Uncharacterized protein n=1 Tax=Auriscalpium vulgare TaxID=40419 RepID=A0ACB8RYY4_9AGAM|nr:hypothetical protein FA95DRAFT_890220 [Auriscalpium vulgare]
MPLFLVLQAALRILARIVLLLEVIQEVLHSPFDCLDPCCVAVRMYAILQGPARTVKAASGRRLAIQQAKQFGDEFHYHCFLSLSISDLLPDHLDLHSHRGSGRECLSELISVAFRRFVRLGKPFQQFISFGVDGQEVRSELDIGFFRLNRLLLTRRCDRHDRWSPPRCVRHERWSPPRVPRRSYVWRQRRSNKRQSRAGRLRGDKRKGNRCLVHDG